MIEYYLLQQFVAFAESGTLLKASEKANVSQPSLTRSMRKLEDLFGVPLFDRSNSRISLNATGKIAAEYAKHALDANQEMIDRVIAFDRQSRTISVGSCAPLPLNHIIPSIQERMPEKAISSELADDERLIKGLKNRMYQLAILHENPEDSSLFCQRFFREQLYISIDEKHPLAKRTSVSLEDLKGIRILMNTNVGVWLDILLDKLSHSDLLIQNSFDAFSELVQASNLPFFNSDQFIEMGYESPGRISVPISDPEVHLTYWLTCLESEQKTYRRIFDAARGNLIKTVG